MEQAMFKIADFRKCTERVGVYLMWHNNCLVDTFVKGDIPQQTEWQIGSPYE
jgi:hypothetical protein